MKTKLFLLISFVTLFFSCDILRFNRFEVSSWLPGEGYYAEPEKIEVSLNFTLDPDKASVERNFSLTGNGNRIKGTFSWNNRNMVFNPLTPLELNTDYTIELSADACDTNGLNMDEVFIRNFTTRPRNERPVLLSCFPGSYEEIDDTRTEIRLLFSIPVPLTELYSCVSFVPSMTGNWRLEDNDTEDSSILAIFTPAEPWQTRIRYEIKISSSLTDNNGMNIRNDFSGIFYIGTDNEPPFLVSAKRISNNNEYTDLYQTNNYVSVFNEDWEKDDKLYLEFSEPVYWLTVKNNLSTIAEAMHDVPQLVLETSPLEIDNGYSTNYIFKFETIPVYESSFSIILKPGIKDSTGNESKEESVFKITANGKFSKPPKLIGLRMSMAPQDDTDLQLFTADTSSIFKFIPIQDDYYPSGEGVTAWIELYFDSAAEIDPYSIMELFRIDSSNSVLNFSPRRIKTKDFNLETPQAGWENFKRIEVEGILTNSVNFGVVYFQIGAGLLDSLGNKNENPQWISVIK